MQLFQQAPQVGGAQNILVYSGRVFLDSDTESEGREDQPEPEAPDPSPPEAMEEAAQAPPPVTVLSQTCNWKTHQRLRLQESGKVNGCSCG